MIVLSIVTCIHKYIVNAFDWLFMVNNLANKSIIALQHEKFNSIFIVSISTNKWIFKEYSRVSPVNY